MSSRKATGTKADLKADSTLLRTPSYTGDSITY